MKLTTLQLRSLINKVIKEQTTPVPEHWYARKFKRLEELKASLENARTAAEFLWDPQEDSPEGDEDDFTTLVQSIDTAITEVDDFIEKNRPLAAMTHDELVSSGMLQPRA